MQPLASLQGREVFASRFTVVHCNKRGAMQAKPKACLINRRLHDANFPLPGRRISPGRFLNAQNLMLPSVSCCQPMRHCNCLEKPTKKPNLINGQYIISDITSLASEHRCRQIRLESSCVESLAFGQFVNLLVHELFTRRSLLCQSGPRCLESMGIYCMPL